MVKWHSDLGGNSPTQSFDLPRNYRVTMSLNGSRLDCEWSPGLPTGKQARRLLPHDRRARAVFLARVAELLGAIILVTDL